MFFYLLILPKLIILYCTALILHTVDVTRDAQFVKELLRVRNNEISLRDFTMSEISALIECVCVT